MNATLRALRDGDRWILSREASTGVTRRDGPTLADAIARGRDLLREAYASDRRHDPWALEFTKAALGDGEAALGYADWLVDACTAAHIDRYEISGPAEAMSLRTARHRFRARGLRVRGGSGAVGDRIVAVAAAAAASFALIATLLRHGDAGARIPAGAMVFAVHGEWSTRTRHLLQLLPQGARPVAIVVLGRQGPGLEALRTQWQQALAMPLPPLVRPLSLGAAVRALPAMSCALAEGVRRAAGQPVLPHWRERIAIAYRVLWGEAAAAWWSANKPCVTEVLYGHTGLADTTRLEIAQQASGVHTVHVVHGVSGGLNFVGRSDLAQWRCAHDARWHAALGGYGRCRDIPAPLPEAIVGGRGVLLLSNLAHPMNPHYRQAGVRDELAALAAVAEAAASARAGSLAWKPHPVFDRLPDDQRQEVLKLASELGFERLPAGSDSFTLARGHRWVICTPSTVLLELLADGHMPILLDLQGLDRDSALAAHALRARNAVELILAMQRVGTESEVLRAQTWSAIGPAARLSLPFGEST